MSELPKEKGRGRATVRARGKVPSQQQATSSLPPSRPGPPPAAPAPQAQIPKPRGRQAGGVPGSSQGPSRPKPPVESISESLRATTISEGSDDGARGGAAGERTRGTCRQRVVDLVTRPPNMETKQGSHGEPLTLKANYFSFKSIADWTLYQYRVDFKPDEESTVLRKAYLKPHKEKLGNYLFDGTVLFTLTQILPDPTEFITERKRDNQPIQVIIKKTTDCVMGDYQYLQVLNIIIRKTISALNLQLVGRDYYDPQSKVVVQEFNMEVWPGYVTSIRQHEKEILLNVDVSSKVLRNDTGLHLLRDCKERSSNWQEIFESAIIGTTVITRYNNSTYRIDDVDYQSTPLSTFDMKGRQISFKDYYKEKYNLNITTNDQPLFISKPKAKDIRGGRDNNVVLVPELCCLTGITDSMRSNFKLMRALDEQTRIKPGARIERLERGFLGRILNTPAAQEELNMWNMKFNPQLIQFPGRKLPNEVILHGGGQTSKTDPEADFTRNLRGPSMFEFGDLSNWACIYPKRVSYDALDSFSSTLRRSASSLKFKIPEPHWEEIPDDRSGSYVEAIERAVNSYQPILVMCILMNNKADRYEAIKKKCCVDRALPSQVVLMKNLTSKGIQSICTKIAIQMNCKIGGAPWTCVVPFKDKVMVVGFDVTHDTKQKGRSVGALVASLNTQFSRYFSAVSMHVNGEELSNDIAVQMTKAIIKFRDINKEVPAKIIFYRDGVGDGNINYVLTHEIELLKKSLDQFYPNGGVKMTVVIVSKKVNTRIFNGMDNPPPGTIADDVVTMPDRYDFFLVSQSVKQGTVSPTYYNVIYDTVRLNPDLLQRLTYKMTHLYYNWSGTVRVPATCQYAHKLAFLVGQSIHRYPNPSLEDLLYFL